MLAGDASGHISVYTPKRSHQMCPGSTIHLVGWLQLYLNLSTDQQRCMLLPCNLANRQYMSTLLESCVLWLFVYMDLGPILAVLPGEVFGFQFLVLHYRNDIGLDFSCDRCIGNFNEVWRRCFLFLQIQLYKCTNTHRFPQVCFSFFFFLFFFLRNASQFRLVFQEKPGSHFKPGVNYFK